MIYACIDRITGEEVPLLIQMILDAGARNANIVQAYGKKNRPVFLAFIDVKEKYRDTVIDILVFQFQVTGWHIFSTSHEYIVTKDIQEEIILRLNDNEYKIPISYKLIENGTGWKKCLLESDRICDAYLNLRDSISISYADFKAMIISELHTKTKKRGN